MALRFSKGETALIIGGSSGIGFALSKLLLQEGMEVILLARCKEKLEQAKEELLALRKGNVRIVSADIADASSLMRAESLICNAYSRIHLLVNSAGIVKPGCLMDLGTDEISADILINLRGLILSTKIFLPYIPEGGAIVNLSSAFGFRGVAGYTAYAASKFGVHGFSVALRRELLPQRISVHVVFPSDVDTPMYRQELADMPAWMSRDNIATPQSPDKIALIILKAIKKNKHLIFPGFQVKVFYFLQYHFPRLGRLIIDRLSPAPERREVSIIDEVKKGGELYGGD